MPFDIQPVLPPRNGGSDLWTPPDESWSWVSKQPYNPSWADKATSNFRPGSITGGPTIADMLHQKDARIWSVWKPLDSPTKPALSQSSLEKLSPGTFDLNLVDPLSNIDHIWGATGVKSPPFGGEQVGQDGNPVNTVAGFLGSKDIDPFGLGATGAPARLADYALTPFSLLLNRLQGKQPSMNPIAGKDFAFQRDPRYWDFLVGESDQTPATDDELHTLAVATANQYLDPSQNGYLVEKLAATFKADRDQRLGYSSGDARIDYNARLGWLSDLITQQQAGVLSPDGTLQGVHTGLLPVGFDAKAAIMAAGITSDIPIIGTQLAERLAPLGPDEEAAWRALDSKTRAKYLQKAAFAATATDLIVSLPLLGGLGSALAAAKTGSAVAQLGYRVYDSTLAVAKWTMTLGAATAVGNWAAEAYVPGYSETIGREVDFSRPVSGSVLAAAVNQVGFFSSPTLGLGPLVRGTSRVGRALTGLAGDVLEEAHLPHPSVGTPEHALFGVGKGGARMAGDLVDHGLDEGLLRLSNRQTILSRIRNKVLAEERAGWEAKLNGQPTGIPGLDAIAQEDVAELAQIHLEQSVSSVNAKVAAVVKALHGSREQVPLFGLEDKIAGAKLARRMGEKLDDELARSYVTEYGPGWVQRIAGEYSPEAMAAHAEKVWQRLGLDVDAMPRPSTDTRWAQMLRSLHDYEFAKLNGEMDAAASIDVPGIGPSTERGRITLVTADHLFADQAEEALAILHGEDMALAKSRAEQLVRDTREGRDWLGTHDPTSVDPRALAEHVEDIRGSLLIRRQAGELGGATADLPLNKVHRQILDTGLWEIAFKPIDEAGNFVSYVRTRAGHLFRSPWVEYMDTAAEQIELGNRGLLGSMYDSAFRGFRTWRVTEFQRASLWRSLSTRFDVTPEQIEAFHDDVLRIARDERVPPQAVGSFPRSHTLGAIGEHLDEQLQASVKRIFGGDTIRGRDGELVKVNWRHEIAQAYRQSLRLNTMAGLTSHLKSRFGALGEYVAFASEYIYPLWRFGLSPLFKTGEWFESALYNAARRVGPATDPVTTAMYLRAGVGQHPAAFGLEVAYDQVLQGLGGDMARVGAPERAANALPFYALSLPESMAELQTRKAVAGLAEEFRSRHAAGGAMNLDGQLLESLQNRVDSLVDPATGRLRVGHRPDELAALNREVEAELAMHVPKGNVGVLADMPPEFSVERDDFPALVDTEADGFWHATTQIDSVHRTGLKAGSEIPIPPATVVPRPDGSFDLPTGIRIEPGYRYHVTRGRVAQVIGDEGLREGSYVGLEPNGAWARTPDSIVFRTADDGVLFEPAKGGVDAAKNATTRVVIPPDALDFWAADGTWHPATELHTAMGLGPGMRPQDRFAVSLGTSYHVVSTIAEREQLVAAAVHEQIDATSILDHFAGVDGYNDDLSGIANALKAPPEAELDWGALETWALEKYATPEARYDMVRALDDGLVRFDDAIRVGFTAPFAEVERWDPAQIGVVRVGVRRDMPLAFGQDVGEIRVPSDAAWVVDERVAADLPAAGQEEMLLRQLRQTIDDSGATLPGLEDRNRQLVAELDALWNRNGQGEFGSANTLADVAGTPEAVFETITPEAIARDETMPSGLRRKFEIWAHPSIYKKAAAAKLEIQLMREYFPRMLELAGADDAIRIFRDELHLPEDRWADFLIRDRELYADAATSNTPEAWQRLFEHSGREPELAAAVPPGTPADFVARARTAGEEPGYVYHGTPTANLDSIARNGVEPRSGGISFWSGKVPAANDFERSTGQVGHAADYGGVVLRTKHAGAVSDVGVSMSHTVEPEAIEYFGADGRWHPVTTTAAAPPAPAPAWSNPGDRPARLSPPDTATNDEAMAVYAANHEAEARWKAEMSRGVALGRINPAEAERRGWSGGGRGVAPLPNTLYHATTRYDDVLAQGLKTREEAARSGLGGGDSDTISFTTDRRIADRISMTFHEANQVLNGTLTMGDLLARAQHGDFEAMFKRLATSQSGDRVAEQLYDLTFNQHLRYEQAPHMMGELPEGAIPAPRRPFEVAPGLENAPPEVRENAEMVRVSELSNYLEPDRPDLIAGHDPQVDKYLNDLRDDMAANGIREPVVLTRYDNGQIYLADGNHRVVVAQDAGHNELPTIVMNPDGSIAKPSTILNREPGIVGGDGVRRYSGWYRPMTPEELDVALFDGYRGFLMAQEHGGGPLDPLFFAPDVPALKAMDPAQIGVVTAHPIPGAMGKQVSSLGEWRTWSGDAVKLEGPGPSRVAPLDAFYRSDEWAAVSGLWALAARASEDESFGVHFFNPSRSAFERTVNHPLIGIYPASWAYKAAREWARFLYDNRVFGELRLGMAPAALIHNVSQAQAAAFAQLGDDDLSHWLEKGPLGNPLFIFNLIMPGDWSGIPFPASRTLKSLLRGNASIASIWADNLNYLGATRDVRLLSDSIGDIGRLLGIDTKPDDPIRQYSVFGEGATPRQAAVQKPGGGLTSTGAVSYRDALGDRR